MKTKSSDIKLSRRFGERDWKAAFDGNPNWDLAVNIVEDRIKSRWVEPANHIMQLSSAGFAVLAIDCIILESLWGFMHGIPVRPGTERDVYREMLRGPRFGWTDVECDRFRLFVRNGLMHDAETRSRWLVEKSIPSQSILRQRGNGYVLNRTSFHAAVTGSLEDWLAKLRSGDTPLLNNMRNRMNMLVAKHYA